MHNDHHGCPIGHQGFRGPMGYSPSVVYLAGPIDQVLSIEAKAWRILAKERLMRKGIAIEDPTDRMGFDAKTTVDGDKEAIRRSGLLLAYAPKGVPFVGTSMEIFYAYEDLKKPVVVWGEGNGANPSHWIVMHSNCVFETLDEALCNILGD